MTHAHQTARAANHRWIPIDRRRPNPAARLFCFPYAGAGPQIFRPWGEQLPDAIEVCPVQLPGHGSRWRETPLTRIDDLIEQVLAEMAPLLDLPFALAGHSLGALLAYETAHALSHRGASPACVFASGLIAPHLPNPFPPIHHLPGAMFIAELEKLGGMPRPIMECPELLELLLPALRADFTLLETYVHAPREPLACPVIVFGGDADPRTTPAGLEAWRELTSGQFSLTLMRGDHFFIEPSRPVILRAISHWLSQAAPH